MTITQIPQILFILGFGVRSLTFEDFEKACAVLGFPFFLVDDRYVDEGLSFPRSRNGRKYRVIALRRTLFKDILNEVAWHEFGHALFEHYGVRCFVRGSEDKYEQEADDFSLCCRIPTLWVRTKTREELLEIGFTNQEIDRRKYIFDSKKGQI